MGTPLRSVPVRAGLIAVAVLALAEVVLRIASPVLPSPQVWPYPEVQSKAVEMRQLGARGGADTVFVGSSVVDVGLDPQIYGSLARLPRPAYNAGLLSGALGEVRGWTLGVVVPTLHPSTVVVGVSIRELNGGDPTLDGIDRAFADSAEMRRVNRRETPMMAVDRFFGRWLYLVRYRSLLRQPHALWQSRHHPAPTVDLRDFGMETTMLARPHRPLTPLVIQQFSPFEVYRFGPDRLAKLTDLMQKLRSRGVRVTVLDMPASPDALALLPHHDQDYADYIRRLQAAVGAAGGRFVSAGRWPAELFVDPVHVNAVGADRLTRLLVASTGSVAS